MGELIIHIDQESGAVTKVEQKLDANDKDVLSEKQKMDVSFSMATAIGESERQTMAGLQAAERKISEWLCSYEENCIVTLPPVGNLYQSSPKIVNVILKHRDTFHRHIPLPVELWEKKGRSVCSIIIGGVLHVCYNH